MSVLFSGGFPLPGSIGALIERFLWRVCEDILVEHGSGREEVRLRSE